jgi:type I restriction enzyme S subunit
VIADLKPYPEYKESGLPWLGRVPGHWEVKRAKSIFQCIDERSKTGKEELLTVSSARGDVQRKTASVTMFKAESYLGYKLCWPGDLVINSLWAWAGGLGVSSHHGIISSACGVYRIRQNTAMTPAFVHEVVRSSSFNWELKVRSKGVWISRLQLTDVSFLDAPMHIPPPTEQAAIVRFLDWANGRLERAIRAKRKVIALLTEQKQAIIHRAVTRGLDPSSPPASPGSATFRSIGESCETWPCSHTELSKGFQACQCFKSHFIPVSQAKILTSSGGLNVSLPTTLSTSSFESTTLLTIR